MQGVAGGGANITTQAGTGSRRGRGGPRYAMLPRPFSERLGVTGRAGQQECGQALRFNSMDRKAAPSGVWGALSLPPLALSTYTCT